MPRRFARKGRRRAHGVPAAVPAARRNIMAKGQIRGNKEAKKPKKDRTPLAPPSTFMPQSKEPAKK